MKMKPWLSFPSWFFKPTRIVEKTAEEDPLVRIKAKLAELDLLYATYDSHGVLYKEPTVGEDGLTRRGLLRRQVAAIEAGRADPGSGEAIR